MADLTLIRQADMTLSKCGRPLMPEGVTCVPWPKSYFYQKYLVNNDTVPPYPPSSNEAIEIQADTKFVLSSLKGMVYGGVTSPAAALQSWGAIYLQLQMPSGRMINNLLADAAPFCGFGSGRKVWANPIPCPAGSKIFVTIDDSIAGFSGDIGNFSIMLFFEGSLYYFLRPNGSTPPKTASVVQMASALPRYFFSSPNQNILAPEWAVSGLDGQQCHTETPAGYEDDQFTYSNNANGQLAATFSEAAPVATTIQIQIGDDADFLAQEFMFNAVAGNIAPTFFGRIRTSLGGSSYCDDYVPLNNMRIHRNWLLKRGIQVFIDVYGISNGGDATTTLYVYLKGEKRRRAA